MAQYKVKAPDGETITVNGPDNATEAQIMSAAQHLYIPKNDPRRIAASRSGPLGTFDAFVRGVAQGATFNGADEATAGLNSALPLDRVAGNPVHAGDYKGNLAYERAVDDSDYQHHTAAQGVGTGMGAVLGTLALTRTLGMARAGAGALAEGTGLAARAAPAAAKAWQVLSPIARVAAPVTRVAAPVLKSAAAGAGYGAAAGYGEGRTPAQRAQGATMGALSGAALGGAAHVTVAGLAPIVGRYFNAFVGKNITREALSQMRAALARDGYDVSSSRGLAALQSELGRFTGKPVALADLGVNTRNRVAVGVRTPSAVQGPTIDALNARTAGQPQRLTTDIKTTVAPRTDVHALDASLVANRDATALPLKQAALNPPNDLTAPATPDAVRTYAARPDVQAALTSGGDLPAVLPPTSAHVPDDTVLQGLARLPMAQAARASAESLTSAERLRLGVLGEPTDHLATFPTEPDAPLSMGALDVIKRNLDTQVNKAFTSTDGGVVAGAPELKALRDALRTRMRAVGESSPGAGDGLYGQYLDQYGGAQELRDSLTEGRDYRQLDPEHIITGQADRSQAGQEFFRVGAARDLVDQAQGATDNSYPADRILNSPEARAQLGATGVEPEGLAQLIDRVGQERQLNALPKTINGVGGAQARVDSALPTHIPFNIGSPTSWLGAAAQNTVGAVNLARSSAVNEALLPRAVETDPDAIQKIVSDLQATGQEDVARQAAITARANGLAKYLGITVGGPATYSGGPQ